MSRIFLIFLVLVLILGGVFVYFFISEIETPATIRLKLHYGPSLDDYEIFNVNETSQLLQHPKFVHDTTHLYIPGLSVDHTFVSYQVVVNAYLKRGSVNIITLEWPSKKNFVTSVFMNVPSVALALADTIINLYNAGLPRESLTLLGYSIGGQIAGHAGREIISKTKGQLKIHRIALLDVQYPLYTNIFGIQATTSVNKNDADHVQAIHTSSWIVGQPHSIGHIDFYPNSGIIQRGCQFGYLIGLITCNHKRSYIYWSESVEKQNGAKFLAFPSTNYWSFLLAGRKNLENDPVEMGFNCPKGSTGDYYLKTNSEYPFAMGMNTLD